MTVHDVQSACTAYVYACFMYMFTCIGLCVLCICMFVCMCIEFIFTDHLKYWCNNNSTINKHVQNKILCS